MPDADGSSACRRSTSPECRARKQLPPDGVYAVRVEWRGGQAGGMMNQGPRPTFGENDRTLEAHLFGVDADLYGEWVRLEWVARLREVRQFASPAELTRQLERDHAAALAALGQSRLIHQTRATRTPSCLSGRCS